MLKLVHNLRCRSNFAKRILLFDSCRQNSPKRPYFTKVGDFIGDFYQQLVKNLSPCHASSVKGRAIIFRLEEIMSRIKKE